MAEEKIRVLHIIKSLGRGGAEMLLPETLTLHNKDKFEFHYIYFLPWKDQVVGQIKDSGGTVTCIPASNNIKIILSTRKVAAYIKKNKIKIVHCHLPWAGIVGRLSSKLTSVKVLYTEHNKWERYHALTYKLNKLTFPWQDIVIPCSKDVETSIRTHYTKRKPEIFTIPNGVNTQKFSRAINFEIDIREQLQLKKITRVIGIISVFRVQKRLFDWLHIAKELHDLHPDTYFIIVGDGPLNEQLRAKAKAMNMEDYLHFSGLQSEVRPYLKAMDIFMMTSEFEGLPIALLEAMSLGCIPACTSAGGIPEVIENNYSGLLVDVKEPNLLSRNISQLLDDWDNKSEILSASARETVRQKFSLEKMVNQLEAVYQSVKD
ncbi:MAG: glycosyltransferase [Filimonas sp.]|nr:glycosyltransferase [Filimonas sp.]